MSGCRLLSVIISDFHKPVVAFVIARFAPHFVHLDCHQNNTNSNFSLSLVFLASQLNILLAECTTNEIAALLLECSAVPALAAIVIMLSLSAMSAVNCVFLSGKAIILCGSNFFSLFQSISFSRLCGVMLCSSAVSLLFNNRMNCGIL